MPFLLPLTAVLTVWLSYETYQGSCKKFKKIREKRSRRVES
ncbi:Uncharacterised protein [Wolinella succinogenes]|nr:Uncharacterised protein [Wolinella succinogenes]